MSRSPMRSFVVLAAALCLSACRGVQTMLDPVGDQARHVDVIWRTMLGVCGVMYVLVLAFLAWALWRARTRPAPQPTDPAISGPTPAEPALEQVAAGHQTLRRVARGRRRGRGGQRATGARRSVLGKDTATVRARGYQGPEHRGHSSAGVTVITPGVGTVHPPHGWSPR